MTMRADELREIRARQLEAEMYDLEALELEAEQPAPPPPKPQAVACLHPRAYRKWGHNWCQSCGVLIRGR
jgi:hypothetical protein